MDDVDSIRWTTRSLNGGGIMSRGGCTMMFKLQGPFLAQPLPTLKGPRKMFIIFYIENKFPKGRCLNGHQLRLLALFTLTYPMSHHVGWPWSGSTAYREFN